MTTGAPSRPDTHTVDTGGGGGGTFGLRVMLIVHALAVVGLGLLLWRLLLAYHALASVGTSSKSDPTGLNVFLAVMLGPTPLLHPLAAWHLARHPRRAKTYLAVAVPVAWAQVIGSLYLVVLFTPVAGLSIFFLVVPFSALVIAWTVAAQKIDTPRPVRTRRRGFWRRSALDLAVFAGIGTVLVLVVAAVWDSTQWKGQTPPRDFNESVAWEKMETAVSEVTPVFAPFEGFASRTVTVRSCPGLYEDGGDYVRYELSYLFTDAVQTDPQLRSQYRLAAREHWLDQGHGVQFDRQNAHGDWSIVVHDGDGLRLAVYEGHGLDKPIELNVQTGCVERVGTPPCLDPQGGVPPEADQITGIRCPR